MQDLAVVILAAGHGVRMRSRKQKVMHEVGGKPMIAHAFDAACSLSEQKPVIVVGPGEQGILQRFGPDADFVEQVDRLGTGHATLMAAPLLQGKTARVLVTYGDMPLLRRETLAGLVHWQEETGAAVVMLSVMGRPDSSFGRVVRDEFGKIQGILEAADAAQRPDAERLLAIREQNVGVYCFAAPWLWENLPHLPRREAREGPEYYLTDMVEFAVRQGRRVEALTAADPDESLGAGTRAELVLVEKAFRRRANQKWLAAGVTLIDPDVTYIDQDVIIGQDTVIWPNTYIQGSSVIGDECVLGPNTIIRNAHIGPGCRVEQAVVANAVLPAHSLVQPFTIIGEAHD